MKKVEQTDKLLNFADFLSHSEIFIETGTCLGRSVDLALVAGYKEVRSVEAKEEYFHICVDKFESKPEVKLFLGKSIDHLQNMLNNNKRCVIWLDAHVSGEASAGYQDYMEKGEGSDYHQHTALKKELEIVLKHSPNHLIIIDDQNGANDDNAVYIKMISEANPSYKFYWYDEQMGEIFYKNKILVAIP
jgi:hypothetical protein